MSLDQSSRCGSYRQTVADATTAVEAAGHKNYGGRFYDPRKRGAYVTLVGGYSNAQYEDMVVVQPNATTSKGGPSGAFCAEISAIVEANRNENE